MERYEITIDTSYIDIDKREKYENDLIVSLARCGYTPYFSGNDKHAICFTTDDTEVYKINKEK